MIITVLAVPFNVLLNYSLIFGNFGMPKLGGIGAGYATGITFWIILIISIIMTFRIEAVKKYKLFVQWVKPSFKAWKEQLSIGIPIGLSIFFEASIFSVVTLLIGNMFSTTVIAANQIVISFTTLLFMIPLSISMAITIVVGYSIGGKKLDAAKQYAFIGVLGAIGFLASGSVFMFFFREPIAYLYTTDPIVVQIAGQLFIIAIIYQLSDASQASLQGVLRGLQGCKSTVLYRLCFLLVNWYPFWIFISSLYESWTLWFLGWNYTWINRGCNWILSSFTGNLSKGKS